VAATIYLGCILSPPSLMDDVDAVQAQIARNMLTSGDWVTARLDGVVYLEKSPLIYWLIAISTRIFGALRLGGAHSGGAGVRGAGPGSRRLPSALGIRQAGGLLCRALHVHVHRAVPVHADSDSRRDADASPSRSPCGRFCACWMKTNASAPVGICAGRESGSRTAAEERDRVVFPLAAAFLYLVIHAPTVFAQGTWRRLHPFSGLADHAADRRAVARAGDAAQSSVFRLHDAQRAGRVPRISVVLSS
jgi:hypothetical protein